LSLFARLRGEILTALRRLDLGFFGFWGGLMADGWGATVRDGESARASSWDVVWRPDGNWTQTVRVDRQGKGEAGIIQVVSGLPRGASFRFSAQAYQTSTGTTCWIAVDPSGATSLPARTLPFLPNVAGQWYTQEMSGTVGPSGAVSVFLWAWHQWDAPATCSFDGARLSVSEPTPAPTPTPPPAGEALHNGDFEAGFFGFWGGLMAEGWGATFRDGDSSRASSWDGVWRADGDWTQTVQVDLQGKGEAGIIQVASGLPPGASFRFSARAYQTSTNTTCWLAVDPAGGTKMPARTLPFPNVAGQWNTQETTGTVGPSGAVSVFLWAWHQWDPRGTCSLDGASLVVGP
jgi:hypothetical protein